MQYTNSKESLQHFRDHILRYWRVSKRGESRERIQQALDEFIDAIATPPPSNTTPGTAADLVDDVLKRFKSETNLFRELKEIAFRCHFNLSIDRGIEPGVKDFRIYSGLHLMLWTQDIRQVTDFLKCHDLYPDQLILSTEEDLSN
ncbi:MAG: hypothetical protein PUP93_27940 [Rhizonema sp. NSF051]|nr:hypothetical protein [Rhizonema sp. NSF051]